MIHSEREYAEIVILEDHPLVAKITQEVVLACAPKVKISVLGTIHDFERLEITPAAVLTDLTLPDADGYDVISAIKRRYPNTTILVSTASDSPNVISELQSNNVPWVHKRAPSHELFSAVVQWLQTAGVLDSQSNPFEKLSRRNSFQSKIIAPGADKPLTIKQVQIMECCTKGLSAKETARVLGLGQDTVRAHMTEIFHRLNAKNVAQAVDIFNRAKREAELRSLDLE